MLEQQLTVPSVDAEQKLVLAINGRNDTQTILDTTNNHVIVPPALPTYVPQVLIDPLSNSSVISFDGVDDHFIVAASDMLILDSSDFTIEFYLYQTSQKIAVISDNRASNHDMTEIAIDANNSFRVFNSSNNSYLYSSIPSLPERWNHHAITRQNGVMKLLVNHELGASGLVPFSAAGADWKIGKWTLGWQYCLNGLLRDFKVYKGLALYG